MLITEDIGPGAVIEQLHMEIEFSYYLAKMISHLISIDTEKRGVNLYTDVGGDYLMEPLIRVLNRFYGQDVDIGPMFRDVMMKTCESYPEIPEFNWDDGTC
jgi:hypothetical protein